MPTITTHTGNDQHTSNGVTGQVYVITNGVETPIYKSPNVILQEDTWSAGTNFRWCEAEYTIADGMLLKLYAMSTWRGTPRDGGSMYFVVDSSLQPIKVYGPRYSQRGGWIMGSLRPIPLDQLPAYGITVEAKHRKYYKEGLLTLEIIPSEPPAAEPIPPEPEFTVTLPLSAQQILSEIRDLYPESLTDQTIILSALHFYLAVGRQRNVGNL